MRRTMVVGVIAALLTASLVGPADAGKKKKPKPREMELTYSEPAIGTAGLGVCFQGSSCLFYGTPLDGERFVGVIVEDASGQDVYATVIQDTNEDGNFLATDDLTVGFCTATEEPIEIEAGRAVSVWVWQGPGADPPCVGVASSGTATATFSAKP